MLPTPPIDHTRLDSFTTFGDLLRHLRRRAHLKLSELSIAVDYSISQVSRLERNERVIDVATLLAVFVPALRLEQEPAIIKRLTELAAAQREAHNGSATFAHRLIQPPHANNVAPKRAVLGNLPYRLTSFIGRTELTDHLHTLLTPKGDPLLPGKWAGSRLVTLTGAGGVGKTSVAVEVAAGLYECYPDGIWLVELAPIADPALVDKRVARSFNLPDQPTRSHSEAVIAFVEHKRLLLILDNCEHQLDATVRFVDQLLHTCPRVVILATSREPLNVTGEVVCVVKPLSTPPLQPTPQFSEVFGYEAIRLFVERAHAAKTEFTLTPANVAQVAQICRRLDGVPLAIELAAVRIRGLSLEQIATRLDDRLQLLTSAPRNVEPRHRTLRDAIAWSYDLLIPAEQNAFRRLGVFAGGCTSAAAAAILEFEIQNPLDLLDSLVNKNLLLQMPTVNGEVRYMMLEMILEFAREQLVQSGELAEIQRRHAQICLHFAEAAGPHLYRTEQIEWLAQLDADHDNMRAALTWSLSTSGDPILGLQLANALGWFWYLRCHYVEGSRWLDQLLERASERAPLSLRGWAFYHNCSLATGLDDNARGMAMGEAAEMLATTLQDQQLLAYVARPLCVHILCQKGKAACHTKLSEGIALVRTLDDPWINNEFFISLIGCGGEWAQPLACYQEALALARAIGDRRQIICILESLNIRTIEQGDFAQATSFLEESLNLARQLQDQRSLLTSLLRSGELARLQGHEEEEEAYYQESLPVAAKLGTPGMVAWVHEVIAQFAQQHNDPNEALHHYQQGLRLVRALQHRLFITSCLVMMSTLAELPCSPITPQQATSLLGAAFASLDVEHMRFEFADLSAIRHSNATIRARLNDPIFAAAWAAGQALTLDEVVGYALAL